MHTPFEVVVPRGTEKPLLCLSPDHGRGNCGYEWEIRGDDDSWRPLVVDTCLLYGRCPGEYRCWIKRDESGYHQGSPFDFTLKRKIKDFWAFAYDYDNNYYTSTAPLQARRSLYDDLSDDGEWIKLNASSVCT